jgi:hypothetical protein
MSARILSVTGAVSESDLDQCVSDLRLLFQPTELQRE